ncbi:MAG: membrane integrity-associated transporter subunit PqiC, partial [Alphaproteobacteria bacterium]|nr:membrane integrity-associated transporter subunit PqiC [Alphaproteobacteria bacterium]
MAGMTACSSPPSRLYLLSSTTPAAPGQASAASSGNSAARAGAVPSDRAPSLGVAVAVPDYLDRLDIIERTSANEIKPNYDAQWGEDLSVTATRALVGDLAALIPSHDVVMLSSPGRRKVDYRVRLDLSRFESTPDGQSVLAGRWSIIDVAGNERAGGRIERSEPAAPGDFGAMAA